MTDYTDTAPVPVAQPPARRRSIGLRFFVAFVVGMLLTLAVGVGALYAYDQQYVGRVLPGVHVGTVDLSGLSAAEATARLEDAYGAASEGEILLSTPSGTLRIPYRNVGRRVAIETLVDEALAVGRSGGPIDRAIANARTGLRGVTLQPKIVFDADAVAPAVETLARTLDLEPSDASVATVDGAFVVTDGVDGRSADREAAVSAILARLGDLDLGPTLEVELPTTAVEPEITTAEAAAAVQAAERIATDVVLQRGDNTWTVKGTTIRAWVSFAPDGAGGYAASVDTQKLPKILKKLAKEINQPARNARFRMNGTRIVGVIPHRQGKGMDIDATTSRVEALLTRRAAQEETAAIAPVMEATDPALTTAEAEAVIPKMRKISSWTTYFPISEKNGFGANIWIPAMDLDGHVVGPGETFDFWASIGAVTRERGYRDGGAIINGRTEPQGALAGGICSTSTTLFNAALRAGYEMGARRNHYYYIDRYPLGLDATVFRSGKQVQTMSFTNDTDFPIIIRAYKIREGSSGYVRFDLWSAPTKRTVSFSRPTVRNVRPASDRIQYTNSLAPGRSQRIEYPADGKQVWVTRTVRDRKGRIIHRETYYSNYARIDGITLVGR